MRLSYPIPGYHSVAPLPVDGIIHDLDRSDRLQHPMRRGRQLDGDRVKRPHLAVANNDAHDAGLADEVAGRVPVQRGGHQALLELVDLDAGIAQAGDFDDGGCAEMQAGTGEQRQQIDTGRRRGSDGPGEDWVASGPCARVNGV
jgi:hypothetical protein